MFYNLSPRGSYSLLGPVLNTYNLLRSLSHIVLDTNVGIRVYVSITFSCMYIIMNRQNIYQICMETVDKELINIDDLDIFFMTTVGEISWSLQCKDRQVTVK